MTRSAVRFLIRFFGIAQLLIVSGIVYAQATPQAVTNAKHDLRLDTVETRVSALERRIEDAHIDKLTERLNSMDDRLAEVRYVGWALVVAMLTNLVRGTRFPNRKNGPPSILEGV